MTRARPHSSPTSGAIDRQLRTCAGCSRRSAPASAEGCFQPDWSHPMKNLIIPAVFVLGLGVSGAMAQMASDFVAVDADQSGDVTLAEAQAIWPDLTEEAYAAADTSGDGMVDQAEYTAFL